MNIFMLCKNDLILIFKLISLCLYSTQLLDVSEVSLHCGPDVLIFAHLMHLQVKAWCCIFNKRNVMVVGFEVEFVFMGCRHVTSEPQPPTNAKIIRQLG